MKPNRSHHWRTPVDGTQRTRWDELCSIVKIVIRVGAIFDSNGVDIFFLNRESYCNVQNPNTIDKAFEAPPSGFTPLVSVLKDIFTSKLADRGRDKNLLVFIATDGLPTDDDGNTIIAEFETVMEKIRRVETTYVSFLLCTDEQECVDYMEDWSKRMKNIHVTDDYHTQKVKIRQCQGNANLQFSHGEYIINALIGAID